MPEKIRDVRPPRGLARLDFRLPIWLYRLGLGGLLSKRFLLLIHTGRKSGLKRQNVLEVVRYDEENETFTVAAGFGTTSDWYRNLQHNPRVQVQCGTRQWDMTATFLSPAMAAFLCPGGSGTRPYSHCGSVSLSGRVWNPPLLPPWRRFFYSGGFGTRPYSRHGGVSLSGRVWNPPLPPPSGCFFPSLLGRG